MPGGVIPRSESGRARSAEELEALARRHGMAPETIPYWVRGVLRGREIAALARRGALSAAGRRALAKQLRGG